MADALRLGIAGLGTVGTGVIKMVQRHGAELAARAGQKIEITAVCARDRAKDRGVRLTNYAWEDDPVALAQRNDVDVFVELMGGTDGPAKAATEAALAAGKDVVTAPSHFSSGVSKTKHRVLTSNSARSVCWS